MWKDLAHYIINNYSKANKIIEVGVGRFPEVALILEEYLNIDIIMTDIKPSHTEIIKDDITKPNLKIYNNSSLIYSIRPPPELHPYLINLAKKILSDLIILPVSTELINTNKKMTLVNYKKAYFFKMSP
jgi:uncharacterized protein